jgi:hypothetical protein
VARSGEELIVDVAVVKDVSVIVIVVEAAGSGGGVARGTSL